MIRHFLFSAVLVAAVSQISFSQEASLSASLREHVSILAADSMGGRGWGYPEKYKAVKYITEQYRNAGFGGFNGYYFDEFLRFENLFLGQGVNIIGVIEGSDPVLKNEYIILGAHFDHLGWKLRGGEQVVWNGADDNASGVATIIEAGKILMGQREKLRRSIIIAAFDAEEAGLYGSTAFMADTIISASQVKAMFSIDMVGMYLKNKGVDLSGFRSLEGGVELSEKIALNEGVTVRKSIDKISRNTDTWPFAKKGIPSASFNTGLISPYHKPEDDSELLDYEGMAQVTQLLAAITVELAAADAITPNKRFIKENVDPSFQLGYRIDYGWSRHRFPDEFYSARGVFSLETGIVAKMKLSRSLLFQPGIAYEYHGSNSDNGKFHFHSVSPTAALLLKLPVADENGPRAFLSGGIFYRYNFAATMKSKSYDFKQLWTDNDFGIRTGFGFDYAAYQVGFFTQYGLNMINNVLLNPGNVKSRSYFISIVSFF
jgi:hypothetical protein